MLPKHVALTCLLQQVQQLQDALCQLFWGFGVTEYPWHTALYAHLLAFLQVRVFYLSLNPYATISSFLLQLSMSPAQAQKSSLISPAFFPFSLTISDFLFTPGSKLTPKFSLLFLLLSFPLSLPGLFCAFLQFPSCPAPNPSLPSAKGSLILGSACMAPAWGLTEHVLSSFSGRRPVC